MNKNKIIAILLILAVGLCSMTACGNSDTPGEKNEKLVSETDHIMKGMGFYE